MTSYKKTMRQALEEMYPIVEEVELDEAKYELYHKDFSSAMQHAYHVAKKHHGITIDPKEIDDKVATGPSKPSEGKTNKYRLKGDKGAVQIQVYNKGGSKPFELNMYKEEVELDEGTIDKVKEIASKKSAAKIDGVMVDSFTASAISQIYDKVNDANKKKMEKLPITKLANLAFKMMNKEELAKIKGNTPADKGRKSAVEDDIERAEKKGDKKEVENLKEVDIDEKEYKVTNDKLGVWTGTAHSEEDAKEKALKKWSVVGNVEFTRDTTVEIIEEVEIDEAIPESEYYYVDPKGVVVAVGSKDAMRKMNMKQAKDGNKGGSFSQNSKKYKVGDKIKEEVELDEGGMKDLLIKAQELMGPSKNRKEGIQMVAKGLKVSEKEATKLVDAVIKMNEEVELDEGKMSQLHQYIKDKKSAEEIAKLMKVDVKTIKALMSSYESTDGDTMGENSEYMEMLAAACGAGSMDEGAAADARRAMMRDKDLGRKKDSADVDDFATDDDVKAASKNIIMQMRKAVSMKGNFPVEFGDKKKVKIPVKVAQAVQQKYNSMKKPADKEKFQVQVAKSYKDMLRVLKAGYYEELKPQKESILDRIDKKLKERKNG